MKRWIVILILAVPALWFVIDRLSEDDLPPPVHPAAELRTLDVRDVVAYTEMSATTYRVRTTRDVIPGDLSAAMAPVLVVWDESQFTPDGVVTIRNLNHGGNPVSGVTVLRTARLHPSQLREVQYVMVPLGGPEAVSHGQLRFLFEDGGVELLGNTGDAVGEADEVNEIILSWEAWRPPGVDYSVLAGMDHHVYQLSLRAYSGTQRFLEDALAERDWHVYTLDLPADRRGAVELLGVALALGDGAARYVIGELLDEASDAWAEKGPDSEEEGGDAAAQWRALRERAASGATPYDDPRLDLSGLTGYQSLLRSCATMALYSVDLTVSRLIEAGAAADGRRPTQKPEIKDEPRWMQELAETNIAGVFLRAPRTLNYIHSHPTTIPGQIPGAMDEAGLLVREDGKAHRVTYSMDNMTPWGPREHLLIR
jgi:hypothetical protein